MVLMISIVPAFALNDTNSTNGTQDQTQTQIQDQSGTADQNCQKNCDGQKCSTCDGNQHKYQYGLKNDDASAKNCGQNSNCPKN